MAVVIMGVVISAVMTSVGLLALAPVLITAAAIWWRWVKEAFGEFIQ